MGGQLQRFHGLRQGETVANQPLQVHLPLQHKASRFVLQVYRSAVGSQETLFVDANRRRIDRSLPALRLRELQNPSAGTGCIHGRANQACAGNRKDYGIGPAAFRQFPDGPHNVAGGGVQTFG